METNGQRLSELQLHAQTLLRINGIELGDDRRTEIQVAVSFGLLTLDAELYQLAGVPVPVTTKV